MENIIYYNYTNPKHPTAFGSKASVAKYYREDISIDKVKSILEQHHVYSERKRKRKTKKFIPIYAYFKRELLQIDLCEVQYLKYSNSRIRYLLMIYDTATKKCWVIPCKDKKAVTISGKLDHFFETLNEPIRRLISDRGSEFKAAVTQDVFKKYNIKHDYPTSQNHCPGVERFNQTFQHILYKFLASRKNNRYIDNLQDLTDIYNNRYHRTIKMSPNQAELKENSEKLARTLFYLYGKNILHGKKIHKKSELFIQDYVRIKLPTTQFARSYQEQYSKEIYIIHAIDISKHIPFYTLISQEEGNDQSTTLSKKFYEEDLQKVGGKNLLTNNNILKVPNYTILDEKTNSQGEKDILVHWNGYKTKYDTWTPKKLLLSKEILIGTD